MNTAHTGGTEENYSATCAEYDSGLPPPRPAEVCWALEPCMSAYPLPRVEHEPAMGGFRLLKPSEGFTSSGGQAESSPTGLVRFEGSQRAETWFSTRSSKGLDSKGHIEKVARERNKLTSQSCRHQDCERS
jgi:hypothetical protein